jgi:integrase
MPLRLKKRGDIYHYSGTVAGRRLRGSTKTTLKDQAEFIANEVERRYLQGHRDPASVLTFAQAAIQYRQIKGEPRYLVLVEDYWKDKLVKDITPGEVERAAHVLMPTAKGSSRNRAVIAPTLAVINNAAKRGLCPRLKVERFPVVAKRKEPATWEWVQAFMEQASPHLGALCCFMFLTGTRKGEAVGVLWRDVDLTNATVTIRMGKLGGETRDAHMPAALVAALANIPSNREPEAPVFVYSSSKTFDEAWDNVIKRAKIKRLTPHSCRHGFATGLLHRGVDPVTVAKLGGWKTPALVLSTYGHALRDTTVSNLLTGKPVSQSDIDMPQVSVIKG